MFTPIYFRSSHGVLKVTLTTIIKIYVTSIVKKAHRYVLTSRRQESTKN